MKLNMKCGFCDKTDGVCYTSNPLQVKCTVTNKFHYYGDECDAYGTINVNKLSKESLAIQCIVCGEGVELTSADEYWLLAGRSNIVKVCDKCKQAILHMRKLVE